MPSERYSDTRHVCSGDTYAQACANEYSNVWHRAMEVPTDGLIGAGTFGAKMGATFGGTSQRNGINLISAN